MSLVGPDGSHDWSTTLRLARTAVLVSVALAIAVSAFCASEPPVQRMLPGSGSVKDFSIVARSLQYGKGSDLTRIYDGGYELYTKHGVVDAARQMYQRGGDYVEVTIHTMTSPKAALDFLKYWQKEYKAKSLEKGAASTGFVIAKPNVMAYFAAGRYFATVSAFHAADKATKDVKAFRSVIESRIRKAR